MSLEPTTFETVLPCRYVTFSFPKPYSPPSSLLRVAVLDSPNPSSPTAVAAILIPPGRESDWIFSTESGHLQLLLTFPHLSRLILIGDSPTSTHPTSFDSPPRTPSDFQRDFTPLLIALTPKSAFPNCPGVLPDIPFLVYEDEVVRSAVLEICVGPCVGEMLVEDVQLELPNGQTEFRRRLRFKRMPNLVQTQVKIYPKDESDFMNLEGTQVLVDNGLLVHPYLPPMVAGLSKIGLYLDERIMNGVRPKALCLGVGGGALLGFLSDQLGFEVLGVEEDEAVLTVARKYFGLKDSELVQLRAGNAIEFIETLAFGGEQRSYSHLGSSDTRRTCCFDESVGKFDVVMVDLDSSDARLGMAAPPLEFTRKSAILASRMVLLEHGVLIINLISPNLSFYRMLTSEFYKVYEKLYEIDVGNGENVVLIAVTSHYPCVSRNCENLFLNKLKEVISGSHMDSVREVSPTAVSLCIDGGLS